MQGFILFFCANDEEQYGTVERMNADILINILIFV